MPSDPKNLIAVTGATGLQGGSVIRFLLDDGGFAVRAVTRNVESPKAKELAAKGVEVVQANQDDPASLKKAFEGAYGVFGLTTFWEHFDMDKETQQGKNLVDAAKAAGVQHFVWSSLERSDDPVILHCNSKAAVADYLKTAGIPYTLVVPGFYFENFLLQPFQALKKEDGKLVADWPLFVTDGPIGGFSVSDFGAYAFKAFIDPHVWNGKQLDVDSEVFTVRQYVELLSKASGQPIAIKEVDQKAFDAAKDIPGMFEIWATAKVLNVMGNELLKTQPKKLYPEATTLAEFVQAHAQALIDTAK